MWHGVNLGIALEFEWVDQGMMQVGLFFKVLFYVLSYATSCGGTQSVMVLMSTTSWLSTHGRLKWRPEGVAAGAKQKDNWYPDEEEFSVMGGMEWDGPVKTYLVPWSLRLKGDPGERWQLFRTLGPPERPNSWVSTFFSECIFITLKHTQSENGKVTITMTQEKAVRSHPQIPMPMSPSLAGRKEKKLRVGQKVRKTFFSSGEK